MKFANRVSQNTHFHRSSYGGFIHTKTGKYFGKIDNYINYAFNMKIGVEYCEMGALLVHDYGRMWEYKFINNEGNVVLDEKVNEFKSGYISHNVSIFDSGVCVNKYRDKGLSDYDFYFYDGEKLHENDFDKLIKKVEKREYEKQVFSNPDDYFYITNLTNGKSSKGL